MLSDRAARTITAKKTWAEIEVQPIKHHIATRDVVVKFYSMEDSGEVCFDTETLECRTHFDFRHFHVDHIIPRSQGGTDTEGNLQPLCGSCNTIKGNREMAYLRSRLTNLNLE